MTVQECLDRGDCNYGAYPPAARPFLAASFVRWNELWRLLLATGAPHLELAAAHALSSAWRIYVGRHVRTRDLLPPVPPDVLAFFPASPAEREWWFTDDGWEKGRP